MPQKEIIPLYRIYDIENKEYCDLDRYFIHGNGNVSLGGYEGEIEQLEDQDNYIIERCSGLNKLGQWIFEGDIFGKYGGDIDRPNEFEIWGVTKFDYDLLAFVVNESNGGWVYLDDYKYTNYVIGTIHD